MVPANVYRVGFCFTCKAVGADDCQRPSASDACELVCDAGGELIDCCHALNLRITQSRGKIFFALFLSTVWRELDVWDLRIAFFFGRKAKKGGR